MSVLIIPVATTVVLPPVMLFVVGVPVSIANAALTEWLHGMQGGQALLVGPSSAR